MYDGIEKRKDITPMENYNDIKAQIEGLKEFLSLKIDSLKDSHTEKIDRLDLEIKELKIRQSCHDSDISGLKTKPNEITVSKVDKLIDGFIALVPAGLIGLLLFYFGFKK